MVEIDIIISEEISDKVPIDSDRLRGYARDVLSRNGIAIGEVNIIFIGDAFMAELNRTYKGREGSTDVLSFNLTNEFSEGLSGEIYISLERAESQSKEFDVPLDEEVIRLVTHGLLHLAGHIHDTDEQYEGMMRKTDELIKEFFSGRGVQ